MPEHAHGSPADLLVDAERRVARTRQIVGPEGAIEHRENEGVVAAGAMDLTGVVPAMHRRRYENPGERTEGPGHIGMNEQAVEVAQGSGGDDRPERESEHRQQDHAKALRDEPADGMNAGHRQPADLGIAMMN